MHGCRLLPPRTFARAHPKMTRDDLCALLHVVPPSHSPCVQNFRALLLSQIRDGEAFLRWLLDLQGPP